MVSDLRLKMRFICMVTVDKAEDGSLDVPGSDDGASFVRDVAFSRIESGSISPELLNLVVDEASSELDDEGEVFESLREKSRDRLE